MWIPTFISYIMCHLKYSAYWEKIVNFMACMGWQSHNYPLAFSIYIHVSIGLWMNINKAKTFERYIMPLEKKFTENNANKSIQSEEQEKVDIFSIHINSCTDNWIKMSAFVSSAMKLSRGLSKYRYTFIIFQS